ncbi:MAG: MBL fold metallo-hydrolase [Bacillota bacterium]|nr:MBL fold metallo-hydrolase [Bacillota bacterium]
MGQEINRIDLGGVNCYLVKTENGFLLFDTGGHLLLDKQFDNRRRLLEAELEKAGCVPGNLKLVILTHGDNDHTGNAAYIREKYGTKIAMHKDDSELAENPDLANITASFRFRSLLNKIIFRLLKNQIRKINIKILNDLDKFKPDFYIDEGYKLDEYGFNATVIHIPGHTKGSIGIVTAEGNLISGDIFANVKKPGKAINAFDFILMNNSIERLKSMNIKTVYPGHGSPFEAVDLI